MDITINNMLVTYAVDLGSNSTILSKGVCDTLGAFKWPRMLRKLRFLMPMAQQQPTRGL